jgi:hypothetical protein
VGVFDDFFSFPGILTVLLTPLFLSISRAVYNTTGRDGGGSGGQTTGIFRCSTQWPIMLVGLLRQSLGWIPAEMDAQKKVYWCILLLDTLQGKCCLISFLCCGARRWIYSTCSVRAREVSWSQKLSIFPAALRPR